MPRRFPVLSAFALAILVPALAHADVPPPDGGAAVDLDCTVGIQSTAGRACAECQITSSDTSCTLELGSDYHLVCQRSPTVQVWCNGPSGTPVQGSSCALGGSPVPGAPAGGAALTALLAISAWSARRRRRS